MLAYVLEHFYGRHKVPLVPCYPRDLLGLVVDYCHYHDKALAVTRENIGTAWENYFIHLN